MISIMLPESERKNMSTLKGILPRLGMAYAMIVQSRNQDLSLVQRLMSAVLADSLAPVQVDIYISNGCFTILCWVSCFHRK